MTTRGSAAHPLRDSIADDWTVHSLEWTLARFTVHRNDNKPAYGPIGDSSMALGTLKRKSLWERGATALSHGQRWHLVISSTVELPASEILSDASPLFEKKVHIRSAALRKN
jgi:hypothetical protein